MTHPDFIDCLRIRGAVPDDADKLLAIFQDCARDMMDRQGLDHWRDWLNKTPDDIQTELDRIETIETYVILDRERLLATFAFQYVPMRYFDMSLWREPDETAVYLRRLAVLPEYQGKGVGTWCVRTFERMARDKGYTTVRFDAYYRAEGLLAFYDRLGYERRGTIMLNETMGEVCFEKRLRNI